MPVRFKGGRFSEWISSFDSFGVSLIASVIGFVGGLLLSRAAISEYLKMTITNRAVKLILKNDEKMIYRKGISSVFWGKKQLVIIGMDGNELYRAIHSFKACGGGKSFRQRGYPWREMELKTNVRRN